MSREATQEEIDTFWRDGVVLLREALDPAVVAAMADPVERALGSAATTDMSAMRSGLASAGLGVLDVEAPEEGSFLSGLDHWQEDADFARFAGESGLPSLVGGLLRSTSLRLYEDSVLVKEPGASIPTAFHNDMGYFHLTGDQIATTWVPLDVVDEASGAVTYVVGSHLWETDYRPNYFVSDEPIEGTEGASIPEVAEDATVSFVTQPGDVIVHHARTVHGAQGNTSSRRRRAISIRYCGDDVRFAAKPGLPPKPHHVGMVDGSPLRAPGFPHVWSAQ